MKKLIKLTVCTRMFICPVTIALQHLSSIDYMHQLSDLFILTIPTSLMHSLSEREEQYKHIIVRILCIKKINTQSLPTWPLFFHLIFAHIHAMVLICSPKCSPFNMIANGVYYLATLAIVNKLLVEMTPNFSSKQTSVCHHKVLMVTL